MPNAFAFAGLVGSVLWHYGICSAALVDVTQRDSSSRGATRREFTHRPHAALLPRERVSREKRSLFVVSVDTHHHQSHCQSIVYYSVLHYRPSTAKLFWKRKPTLESVVFSDFQHHLRYIFSVKVYLKRCHSLLLPRQVTLFPLFIPTIGI